MGTASEIREPEDAYDEGWVSPKRISDLHSSGSHRRQHAQANQSDDEDDYDDAEGHFSRDGLDRDTGEADQRHAEERLKTAGSFRVRLRKEMGKEHFQILPPDGSSPAIATSPLFQLDEKSVAPEFLTLRTILIRLHASLLALQELVDGLKARPPQGGSSGEASSGEDVRDTQYVAEKQKLSETLEEVAREIMIKKKEMAMRRASGDDSESRKGTGASEVVAEWVRLEGVYGDLIKDHEAWKRQRDA